LQLSVYTRFPARRPRHVLPPRRFPGRRRLRPHAAGHGEADLCIRFHRLGRTRLVNRVVITSDRRVAAWGALRANWITSHRRRTRQRDRYRPGSHPARFSNHARDHPRRGRKRRLSHAMTTTARRKHPCQFQTRIAGSSIFRRSRTGVHAAQAADNASACCKTFCTAASCKSGGYPYFRNSRFT
jgi:hypothetical protein